MTLTAEQGLRLDTRQGRGVLAAAVLGSGMAMLDGTIVNVALRRIGQDLHASLSELQWVTNAYLMVLASLILLGGALGDRFGRRRMFLLGVTWFAAASALCGAAQSPGQLIAARVLQGAGAALLTPGSLAMMQGTFRLADRAKAIGSWSGLGGIAAAVGPFVGGWLVQYASWRWAFLLNLPIAAVTLLIGHRFVPESRDPTVVHGFDFFGAALCVVALGSVTFALIEGPSLPTTTVVFVAGVGLLAGFAFVVVEERSPHPMLQTSLFGSRQFSAANAMTLLVYAALGGLLFFLVLQLQTVAGYGPLQAGLSTIPVTIVMLLFAAKGGALAAQIGPRLPMTIGPIVCGLGFALLSQVDADTSYWRDVLPGITLFGFGLVLLVAPLTATVLAAAPDRNAGIASGVNNAVARAGSLLAVAALPAVVGLGGDAYDDPALFSAGYTKAVWICVGLLFAGGAMSWLLIRNPERPARADEAVA